jgi:RNA polymerase sigma-70 factor (ECF subfamily)
MSEGPSIRELMQGVRAGDQAAAAEMVRRYEAALRQAVRARLRDARLRRLFDSADVCQSVFASFFVRAALGQYEVDHPEQMVRLLQAMARNKVVNRVEREAASQRDYRRTAAGDVRELTTAAPGPTPSWVAASRELLEAGGAPPAGAARGGPRLGGDRRRGGRQPAGAAQAPGARH